jgi:hypothetical protein
LIGFDSAQIWAESNPEKCFGGNFYFYVQLKPAKTLNKKRLESVTVGFWHEVCRGRFGIVLASNLGP